MNKKKKKKNLFVKKGVHLQIKFFGFISSCVKKSIRAELICVFFICLIFAVGIYGIVLQNSYKKMTYTEDDYQGEINRIQSIMRRDVRDIESRQLSINDTEYINREFNKTIDSGKVMICDKDGTVIYPESSSVKKVDIFSIIKKTVDVNQDIYFQGNGDFKGDDNSLYESIYPIDFKDAKAYLISQKNIAPNTKTYHSTKSSAIYALTWGIISFLILFYLITSGKMKYIETISKGLTEIAKGNLNYKIKRKGNDELALLADNINKMSGELNEKIEEERKSEKTKNDLITNVSHDLRTPLTSIKGYLLLIKDKKYKSVEQLNDYVNIAYNKSQKLQGLINDLFEYTKMTGSGYKLDKKDTNINSLLNQLIDELVPVCSENNVEIVKTYDSSNIILNIDGAKMARVFDNLLMNAIRYCNKPGIIKVNVSSDEKCAKIIVENNCKGLSKEDIERLFERFYRAEKSRSSSTGGSGLGLAIAKSIVEMHGGTIEVSYDDPKIWFTVCIPGK